MKENRICSDRFFTKSGNREEKMKKLSKIIFRLVSCFLIFYVTHFLFCFSAAYSQEYVNEAARQEIAETTFELTVPLKSTGFGNTTGINSATVSVQLDMGNNGDEYKFGSSSENYAFEYELSFGLVAIDVNSNIINGVFDNSRYTLQINNNSPVKIWTKNLSQYISNNQLSIKKIKVVSPQLVVVNNEGLKENVRSFVEINMEYAPGVLSGTTPLNGPELLNVTLTNKTAEFSWDYPYPFSMYQLQVLRLYNIDASITVSERIKTLVDWTKAINLDIPVSEVFDINGHLNNKITTSLTIGEGTGFYAWRVRPVGAFWKGGIANSLNWGTWSVFDDGITVDLEKATLNSAKYFYYADPDEDLNSSFTRIFTEGNKMKEISTYANGLNQVEQIKTYLPSNNVTLMSQSVSDYSGRSALSTLPVPTEGKADGYSKRLLTSGDELYTAGNFDTGTNADPVDEAREMNYYNDSPDDRIPDAEGVPFTQTSYYDDPLNRVKEEGGPGSLQMIKQDGSGKNTKYFYGTPSETELVRVFGKEAPRSESVSKVVKLDPNNIATITYTSSEGKILATCLSFYDNDNNTLEPVSINTSYAVKDEITENMKMDYGFVSSKRIVILQQTDLKIDYSVKKAVLKSNCASLTLDCNFKLDIIIHNVDQGTSNYFLRGYDLAASLSGEEEVITIPPQDPVTLTPGTYIIEKRLRTGNAETIESDIEESALSQIDPLVNLISNWLDEVSCEVHYDIFQNNLRTLQGAFNSRNLLDISGILNEDMLNNFIPNIYEAALPDNNADYYKNHYSLDLYKWDTTSNNYLECSPTEIADLAVLHTLCCNINIPVKWIRKFSFNAEPQLAQEMTNIYPDFEGYAMSYFNDCPVLRGDKFYEYMDGWGRNGDNVPHGTFNLMVYHMLTDRPSSQYTKNSILQAQVENGEAIVMESSPVLDACGNNVSNLWQNDLYTTKGLLECWEGQLSKLKALVGCGMEISFPDGPINPSGEVDGQSDDDGQSFNKSFDDGLKNLSKRRQRKMKKKLSRKMREVSAGIGSSAAAPVQVNLVKDFLDCTGYSFVKILTPYNPKPLAEDDLIQGGSTRPYNIEISGTTDAFKYKLPDDVDVANYFDESSEFEIDLPEDVTDYYYYPLNNWGPLKKDSNGAGIPGQYLFKNIRNPIYAFKYFEYPEEGWTKYQELEFSVCYDDPNDCFLLDQSGLIEEDEENGGFAKGPCCGASAVDDFCYLDHEYPRLNDIYVSGDPRFGSDANGNYKLVVRDFSGEGRVKCPYDHTFWNMGQRFTFYSMLSSYVPPTDINWTSSVNRDCSAMESPTNWYLNTGENDYPEVVTSDEALVIGTTTRYYDFETLDGSAPSSRTVSEVEMDIAASVNYCLNKCSERKTEFRESILRTLKENCYDIDGCCGGGEGTPYENVVPLKDIDVMVTTLVNTCRSQCELNTFACEDLNSRNIKAPRTEIGPTEITSKMLYGMGGFPTEDYVDCENTLPKVYDDVAKYLPYDDGIPGDVFKIYKCKMGSSYGVYEEDYSWYQYTMVTQASNWNFELNLPSKCDLIKLEAEKATEKQNCIVTGDGIREFGNGDIIKFGRVDFGRGAVSSTLNIAVPLDQQGKDIMLLLGGPSVGEGGSIIGTLTTISTGSEFTYTKQSITFNQAVTGIHDLYLVGSGSGTFIANIDNIELNAVEATMSNMRQFSDCDDDQQGSTYMEQSEYEVINANTPPDAKAIVVGSPVTSPAKTVKVTITDN